MTVTETQAHTEALRVATTDVFEQMVGVAPNATHVLEAPRLRGDVMRALGFLGNRAGLAIVTANDELARSICATLLMMEPEELTDPADLSDGFGEVVNMILGGFKPYWVEAGNTMDLSIPSVSFGDPVTMAGMRNMAESYSIELEFDAGSLCVTLAFHE